MTPRKSYKNWNWFSWCLLGPGVVWWKNRHKKCHDTITVTDNGSRGQPACLEEWKMCKRRNINDSCTVMYIRVCYVSYIVVVIFTWTLVRSHSEGRKHLVKLEPLSLTAINGITGSGVATKCMLERGGQSWVQLYTQNEAMKEVLARCHKETDVQVCTLTITHRCPLTVNIHATATYATALQSGDFISMHV